MKKTQILFTALLLALFSQIKGQQKETIYFEKNNYEISEDENKKLGKLIKNQLSDDNLIRINGYTDSDGDLEFNLDLSKKRVQSVNQILLKNGIKGDKIQMNFYGESNPAELNEHENGKQKNRRVEIIIYDPNQDNKSIYSWFKKTPQIFIASAKENIEIKGNEGTIIQIPKYSLVNLKNRTVTGEVQIFLEEYYKKSDIIKANLHTLSDYQMLETGGMINIVIKYKNEELKLKKDSEIKIEFANDDMERMQTFEGEIKEENFNWKLNRSNTPEPIVRNNSIEVDTIFIDTTKNIQSPINNVTEKFLTSNKLNWINCDRFLNARKEDLTNLKVRTNIPAEVKLVFKKISSVMPPKNFENELYEFINLPKKSLTTIIAFTEIDDEPYYARKEITIGERQIENLNLTKLTWEELENEFKILDNPSGKQNSSNVIID